MKNYVYSNSTANAMLNAIATSINDTALHRNIKDYLHYAGKMWWESLTTAAKDAICLLDFDPSVVSSLMFFSRKGEYFDDYLIIRDAISDLVNTIADEVYPQYAHGYVPMPVDAERRSRYKFETQEAITATCSARAVAQEMSADLDRILNLYNVNLPSREFTKASIIEQSSIMQNHHKNRDEAIKTIRKDCLHELMDYLRELAAKEESEGK